MIARYRSKGTLALGWALVGVSLVIAFAVFRRGLSDVALVVAVLVALLGWLIAIRPAIIVHKDALVIQNVIKKHEIPWPTITRISSTLLITVATEDGRTISSSARSLALGHTSKGDEVAFALEQYRMSYGA
jgi:hypothetical protein